MIDLSRVTKRKDGSAVRNLRQYGRYLVGEVKDEVKDNEVDTDWEMCIWDLKGKCVGLPVGRCDYPQDNLDVPPQEYWLVVYKSGDGTWRSSSLHQSLPAAETFLGGSPYNTGRIIQIDIPE